MVHTTNILNFFLTRYDHHKLYYRDLNTEKNNNDCMGAKHLCLFYFRKRATIFFNFHIESFLLAILFAIHIPIAIALPIAQFISDSHTDCTSFVNFHLATSNVSSVHIIYSYYSSDPCSKEKVIPGVIPTPISS